MLSNSNTPTYIHPFKMAVAIWPSRNAQIWIRISTDRAAHRHSSLRYALASPTSERRYSSRRRLAVGRWRKMAGSPRQVATRPVRSVPMPTARQMEPDAQPSFLLVSVSNSVTAKRQTSWYELKTLTISKSSSTRGNNKWECPHKWSRLVAIASTQTAPSRSGLRSTSVRIR